MNLRNREPPRRRALKRMPIQDLGLRLEGSPVEPLLARLGRKLKRFQPLRHEAGHASTTRIVSTLGPNGVLRSARIVADIVTITGRFPSAAST